jgi:hypothetical protein
MVVRQVALLDLGKYDINVRRWELVLCCGADRGEFLANVAHRLPAACRVQACRTHAAMVMWRERARR